MPARLAASNSNAKAKLATQFVSTLAPKKTSAKKFCFAEELVNLKSQLFWRALKMARSRTAAEDLVQDTVERAIRFQATYQRGTNLRAWVQQILFSVFITHCRRGKRERNALGKLSIDPCAWTLPDQPRLQMYRLSAPVARALDTLPKSYRDAVVLVDIEEMAYKDAADMMGVAVGTVMSRLHRGRKMLAEAMRAESGEFEAYAA